MDESVKKHMIHGKSPEDMLYSDIKDIVIPALRKKILFLVEKNGVPINQAHNIKANDIVARAKAICGDLDKMTGYDLNESVKILREEYYLIRLELQKYPDSVFDG